MIQIQSRNQFKNAAARALKERMHVRRYEPGVYEVVNQAKRHAYLVRFERRSGSVFGGCTCEAGHPSRGNRAPMICKHLFAAVLVHNAISAMRRSASAAPATLPEFEDYDDPDCDVRNW